MKYKPYNVIFLTLALALLGFITYLGYTLEPFSGDYTRIGGFTENSFGWNIPQEEFPQSLYKKAQSLNEYNQYYDVVLFGDSFSLYGKENNKSWVNYFANETGLSIIAFPNNFRKSNTPSIDSVIHSEQFKKTPPKIFIIQSSIFGKNNIIKSLKNIPETPSARPLNFTPIAVNPLEIATIPWYRPQKTQLIDFNLATGYLRQVVSRLSDLSVKILPSCYTLSRPFFSSNKPSTLLAQDFLKLPIYQENSIKEYGKLIVNLQKYIQNNQQTFFVYVPTLDKFSIYLPYITDFSDKTRVPYFDIMLSTGDINLPRTDQSIINAIDSGQIDVFLPNDSHWGSLGHKICSQTVLAFLKDNRILPINTE